MKLNLLNPTMRVLSNYANNLTIKIILLSMGFRRCIGKQELQPVLYSSSVRTLNDHNIEI